jgi:uncharacterized repeat protein (TIGR03803 family)
MQAKNGLLYGLTSYGGSNNDGTMFSYDPFNNSYTKLVDFTGTNGGPEIGGNSLTQEKNGLLYGTTFYGGKFNDGVIFSYNITTGKDSVLYNFDSIHGKGPCESLFEDTITGLLYGMAEFGGLNNNNGVLYNFDPVSGKQKVLFNFTDSNGRQPVGTLIGGKDGLLYGLGSGGKYFGNGIIFTYDIVKDTEKIIFNFNDTDGSIPIGNSLIQAKNGLLYGMTNEGGPITSNGGVMFSFDPITDSEKVLFNFTGANGKSPLSSLMQDTNTGLLYGMTDIGGTKNVGVLFSYDITTNKQTILLNFDTANGSYTRSTLLLVRNTPLGVNEITNNINTLATVYPNPASSLLNVEVQLQPNETATICLYNTIGEEVRCETLKSSLTVLPISNLALGIYYYRITDFNNNLIRADKVMIVR